MCVGCAHRIANVGIPNVDTGLAILLASLVPRYGLIHAVLSTSERY